MKNIFLSEAACYLAKSLEHDIAWRIIDAVEVTHISGLRVYFTNFTVSLLSFVPTKEHYMIQADKKAFTKIEQYWLSRKIKGLVRTKNRENLSVKQQTHAVILKYLNPIHMLKH